MHLRYVALIAPAFERSVAFFADAWGLIEVARSDGTVYLRSERDQPFQLALAPGDRKRVERIGFGVDDVAAVDRLARDLVERDVEIVAPPGALDLPGGGYGVRFRDPDGRCIELSAGFERPGALAPRPSMPAYLAHIVVNTPDIDRATAFYTDVLGFRISDWSEHQMSFLRCDREHHSIAFNAAPHASYNHTSWQMHSIDELFRAQGRVRAAGTPLAWGTGRHAPGKQVFNYFVEPSGFVVETITDGEMVDDEAAWVTQVYQRTPEAMDLWNTSGPPSAELRSFMLGESEGRLPA